MRLVSLSILLFLFQSAYAQTEREKDMLKEVNLARTNPKEYIKFIDDYLTYWESGSAERRTANELRKVLKRMKPLEPLVWSDDMYKDAVKHGKRMKRANRFKHSSLPYAENLVGGNETVRLSVVDLLIDHGVSGRGHRKNILDPSITEFAAHEIDGEVDDVDYVFLQEFR